MYKNKEVLIIVDYQKDFVDGALGFEDAKKVESYILDNVKDFLRLNKRVVFTLDSHSDNYLNTVEGKNLPAPHCLKGTDGWGLYGSLASYQPNVWDGYWSWIGKNPLFAEKDTFGSTDLFHILEEELFECQKVVIMGVVTSMCVISNAVIAKTVLPNAEIIVDAMGCADFNKDLESKAFDILENMHIKVVNRKEP